MNLFVKIVKLCAVLILTVSIILLSASFLLKDKVGFIILRSLNKNLSTKLEVGSYKLSFLKKFPKASLELKNVVVHSSTSFNKAEFRAINTDTLLAARLVSVEFRLTDILRGIYTIERISAHRGRANFYTDSEGHVNYNISVKSSKSSTTETIVDLRRINLDNIYAYYNNLGAHLIIGGTIKNGRLKSRITGSNIDLLAGTEMLINRFQLYNFSLDKSIEASLDLNLLSSKTGIRFRKGTLQIDSYDFGIEGNVYSDDFLDLNLTGHNLDIASIRNFLPDKYMKLVADYDPSGTMTVSSKIKGLLNRTSNPHVEINWQLKNGRVAYKKTDLTFKDLSFTGFFSNGSKNRTATSIVSIRDFKGTLGSSAYTGSLTVKEFNNPMVDLSLKGRVYPDEIREFFAIQDISTAEGSADIDIRIVNGSWLKSNYTMDDFIDLKPKGTLGFNAFGLGLRNDKLLFRNVNGMLIFDNSMTARNIQMNYKGQNIKINGEFKNLPEWLLGRPVTLIASADVFFDKLIPESFFKEPGPAVKAMPGPKAFSLPDDLILDINFNIDSLSYKKFLSSKIKGSLNYHPRTLTFKSLYMKSLDGVISGNGLFSQNKNKALITKGNFTVTDIDVNKAFRTFNNFGQNFLKAENIKGTLSGSLSLLLPMDSLMKFHIKTLTAEGKYHLVNGALINFDPVKQLSTFIELSELENISFEQLDNDFFIRNNWLYVPQMEVKSSAADLSVNGKHSFDNDYEYHVKILLSEILSKKRVKNKSNVTEFGVVEDDGLGRTSLLLKIIGKGEEAKVGYDIKAAGTTVKNNMQKEKQKLKTILNQEYGWYKNDSAANQKPAAKKSRFKITWEEGATEKTPPPPPETNKESPLKNLFKKKSP
jgi:hypothetical protein